jgi:hypothetical protein
MKGLYAAGEKFLQGKGVKNPRLVINIGIGIAALALTFIVVRAVSRRIGKKVTSASTQADMTDELSNIGTGSTTLSKGDSIIIAQNLLNAMDRFGTDEDAIFDNLERCKTKGDLQMVIQAFGIKPKAFFGLADTFLERHVEGVMKNLNGWLRDELSGSDLRRVKQIYADLGVPF